MVFVADLEVRERLGEDSWLRLEDEEDFGKIEDEAVAFGAVAVAVAVAVEGAVDGSLGLCGCKAGSGGGSLGSGDSEAPRRFPSEGGGFEDVGRALVGGEYWVPASDVILDEEVVDLDKDLWCEFLGDGGICRGKAAGGGGLIYERGEFENRLEQ